MFFDKCDKVLVGESIMNSLHIESCTFQSAYQQERNNLSKGEDSELINDADNGEFSHLRNIVQVLHLSLSGRCHFCASFFVK